MYVRAAESIRKISYAGYRFPPEVIDQAIWLYLRFTLSLRDVEDLLAERGIAVSYETVRRWVNHFGPMIAAHAISSPVRLIAGMASTLRHLIDAAHPTGIVIKNHDAIAV
jgi:transposase-like protein